MDLPRRGKAKAKARVDEIAGGKVREVAEGEEADEGQHDVDEEETQEPEAEVNQITMMVKQDDPISCTSSFESAGLLSVRTVQTSKLEWLVDSGATCHILSERWSKQYKIVHTYKGPPPTLKGAGDHMIPTSGMVDVEIVVGKHASP